LSFEFKEDYLSGAQPIEYWRWQGFRVPSADTDDDCCSFAEDMIYSQIYNFPPEPKLNKDLQTSA